MHLPGTTEGNAVASLTPAAKYAMGMPPGMPNPKVRAPISVAQDD